MKKLFIGVVAAFICLAFVAPVLAEVKVGGMISSEQFYWKRSQERQAGGAASVQGPTGTAGFYDTYKSVEFGMQAAFNRLNVQYISDDKKIGGFIELRGGSFNRGDATVWNYAYMDWHLNPNFYFRVGRQTQSFSIMAPDQEAGGIAGTALLNNFGNIHGGSSRDAVRAYIKFTDNVRMEINVIHPDSDGTNTAPGSTGELRLAGANPVSAAATVALPAAAGQNDIVREENTIPRIDIALPIKFGNFTVEPAVTWSRSDYNNVAAGSDDNIDAWGASIGAKAGFGPLTIMGEVNYGENLGTQGAYVGTNGVAMTYVDAAGNTRIEDGEELQAWLEVQFDFGPFAIQGMVGYATFENDGDPATARDAAEYDVERWAYGLAFPIKIAKNMTMKPSFFYFDYDGSATGGGAAGSAQRDFDTDLGTELVAGIWWQLVF